MFPRRCWIHRRKNNMWSTPHDEPSSMGVIGFFPQNLLFFFLSKSFESFEIVGGFGHIRGPKTKYKGPPGAPGNHLAYSGNIPSTQVTTQQPGIVHAMLGYFPPILTVPWPSWPTRHVTGMGTQVQLHGRSWCHHHLSDEHGARTPETHETTWHFTTRSLLHLITLLIYRNQVPRTATIYLHPCSFKSNSGCQSLIPVLLFTIPLNIESCPVLVQVQSCKNISQLGWFLSGYQKWIGFPMDHS